MNVSRCRRQCIAILMFLRLEEEGHLGGGDGAAVMRDSGKWKTRSEGYG